MSDATDRHISAFKRSIAPEGYGDECPVCGEPFDAGSSGIVWNDETNTIDAVSWVRVCHGPIPGHFQKATQDIADSIGGFEYVHKDEHMEV